MNKILVTFGLTCVLSSSLAAQSPASRDDLNKPIPMAARRLAIRGVDLAARDRVPAGLTLLKRAIALAPNYIWAHEEYVAIRTFNQSRYDDARTEYERLAAREPDNPIYLMVIAETANAPVENTRLLYEKVVALAPDWAWAHYANALLANDKELAVKVAEFRKCIELDETADAYYSLVYVLENGLGKIDEAIRITERWASQPEYRGPALSRLWQLRLARAKESPAAKTELRTELTRLIEGSRDLKILATARSAYADLLSDPEAAIRVERAIKRIDPSWYAERGHRVYYPWRNESGVAWFRAVVNHEATIAGRIHRQEDRTPREKIAELERILTLKLTRDLRIHIYQEIMRTAQKLKDDAVYVKYGEKWRALEPDDPGLLANLAIALANMKVDLKRAMNYSKIAEQVTTEFRPSRRPPNAPPEWFAFQFPYAQQRDAYRSIRARALDASGWVMCQLADFVAAEAKLRQSITVRRSEKNLLHLAEALRGLNRISEAETISREAHDLWFQSLKRQMISKPAADFDLETIDGSKVSLSGLRNKVVLIDFWATWCAPCREEMPHLVNLYDKYKDRGFEVLAISVDSKSDFYKIAPFAKTYKMTFPILLDEGVSTLYQVKGYPTTVFIDRNGNIRYSASGFDGDRTRIIQAIVEELLK